MSSYLESLNQGLAFQSQGNFRGAVGAFWAATQADPKQTAAYKGLGDSLFRIQEYQKALIAYQKALSLSPDQVGILTNLGAAHQQLAHWEEAFKAYEAVLAHSPNDRNALNNLGVIALETNELKKAEALFTQSIGVDPQWAEAHLNLGITQKLLGQYGDAKLSYQKVIELDPGHAGGHLNLGMTHLTLGEFKEGWREYLWRTHADKKITSRFDAPLWDGTALPGKRLLIHAEQGLGDTLQFLRYLPLAKARCSEVVFRVQGPLRTLVQDFDGVDEVWEEGDETPLFDSHIPLMNLGAIFDANEDTIPDGGGYLEPQGEPPSWINQVFSHPKTKRRFGLVWAGNPGNSNDRRRSCSFDTLKPLISRDDIEWFSLQKGSGEVDFKQFQWASEVVDLGSQHRLDFNETAFVMKHLDGVISVDTSAAHLAGALGVPFWLMLSFVCDWRWLLERDDSIWYSSARLFRQETPDCWASVIQAMGKVLDSP